jgi:hypothetical protein
VAVTLGIARGGVAISQNLMASPDLAGSGRPPQAHVAVGPARERLQIYVVTQKASIRAL